MPNTNFLLEGISAFEMSTNQNHTTNSQDDIFTLWFIQQRNMNDPSTRKKKVIHEPFYSFHDVHGEAFNNNLVILDISKQLFYEIYYQRL